MEAAVASLVIALHVCSGATCVSSSTYSPPCAPSGYLLGTKSSNCTADDTTDCCKEGARYPQYNCSPPVTASTPARMLSVSFRKGGDGGAQAECDGKYHGDNEMAVALSTGWYAGGSRCLKNITIEANGRSAVAKVVDECNSVQGCDAVNAYSPPCPYNIVNANPAVWKALGITDQFDVGDYEITWSDA